MAGVKKTKTVSSKAGDNLNLLPDFLKILFSDKNPKTAKNVILAGITIVITTLAIFLYMLFASRNQWGLENKDTDYLKEVYLNFSQAIFRFSTGQLLKIIGLPKALMSQVFQ